MTTATDIVLRLDLESDALFVDTPTSAGPQESLPYIPGGVLLGLLSRFYEEIEEAGGPDLSWQVFHGGGVRFGNGLPLVGGQPLLPWPRSRTANLKGTGKTPSGDETRSFISEDGQTVFKPTTRFARRTAIDPLTGRVRQGFLFAYRALTEGQSFVSRITVAPGAEAALSYLDRLHDQTWRLGRSRHAEYGRVPITRLDDPPPAPSHGDLAGKDRVSLLAVSDVAPKDHGKLDATLFALPDGWQIDREKTVVKWRRLSVYDGHRQAFNRERHVIVPGSVVAFTGPKLSSADADRLRATLEAGVGLGTERGMGVCLANPRVLFVEDLGATGQTDSRPAVSVPAALEDDPLFKWLNRRHAARTLGDDAREIARGFEPHFKIFYQTQWREARVSGRAAGDLAPSPSQWGAVRDEANRAADLEDLTRRLFNEKDGYCAAGVGGQVWKQTALGLSLPVLKDQETSAQALLKAALDHETLRKKAQTDLSDTDLHELARLVVMDLAVHVPRLMTTLDGQEANR